MKGVLSDFLNQMERGFFFFFFFRAASYGEEKDGLDAQLAGHSDFIIGASEKCSPVVHTDSSKSRRIKKHSGLKMDHDESSGNESSTHLLHREDHCVLPENKLFDMVTPTLASSPDLPWLTII
jgi:hypothetical protein